MPTVTRWLSVGACVCVCVRACVCLALVSSNSYTWMGIVNKVFSDVPMPQSKGNCLERLSSAVATVAEIGSAGQQGQDKLVEAFHICDATVLGLPGEWTRTSSFNRSCPIHVSHQHQEQQHQRPSAPGLQSQRRSRWVPHDANNLSLSVLLSISRSPAPPAPLPSPPPLSLSPSPSLSLPISLSSSPAPSPLSLSIPRLPPPAPAPRLTRPAVAPGHPSDFFSDVIETIPQVVFWHACTCLQGVPCACAQLKWGRTALSPKALLCVLDDCCSLQRAPLRMGGRRTTPTPSAATQHGRSM